MVFHVNPPALEPFVTHHVTHVLFCGLVVQFVPVVEVRNQLLLHFLLIENVEQPSVL
jgi:hypothetical protein